MRFGLAFPVIVFLALFSSAAVAIDSIENVKPEITAVFQEDVVIVDFFLVNIDQSKEYPVELVLEQDSRTFVFVPSKALSNGEYRLTVFASDLVDNTDSYEYAFEVFVPGTRIFLLEPNSIGVANSTTFPVTIYTSRPSVCKYTGISVGDFNDIRLKYFDITGNESDDDLVNDHAISSYSVETDFPRNLYVVCKDDLGRENFEDFTLYADTSPPRLSLVEFRPAPVVEYPESGPLRSDLRIVASEPVICRFTDSAEASYDDMDAFDGFDRDDFDAYREVNEKTVEFPGDTIKETFTYYVQCEDRARFRSVKVTQPVTVDLTAGLKIQVVSPPAFSRENDVFLNITTNRRSYCLYKSLTPGPGDPASFTSPDAALSSSFGNLSTVHFRGIGNKPEGSHTISIRCDVPEGVGLEPMTSTKEYSYRIDNTPPPAPYVNATNPVCDNTLSAEFFANDSSGISEYRWAVGAAGNVFANGSTSDTSVSVSEYNNGSSFELSDAQTYVFSVSAVDGAGNEGPAASSNQITFDASGVTCDSTPPTITLVRSGTGDSVAIECFDEQSGCTSIGSYYGTSYEQPCNASKYYLDPVTVPLFKTTIVCWAIKDNAGNVARGSQVVDLNTSAANISGEPCPGGIDGDGDGYGERCMLGPDCDDTDPDWTVGCPNGCVQDLDGDGYGLGCDAGNDCNGVDPNLTTDCPNNCISDNDGDEFGLGCDNGPDCNGIDSTLTINCPNGCIDDNDGDSYGLGCPVGLDCHGEDHTKMADCANACAQDTDGDGSGVLCMDGLDCHGGDPSVSSDCANGCVFDEDGDSYGFGCTSGLDCNGMNPFIFEGCANNCVSDNDGDGYGWGCDNGADCNDTDPYTNLDCTQTTDCVYDHDGDGFGLGCASGPDCDDYDVMFAMDNCTDNCTYDEDCNGLPDDWQEGYFNSTVCDDPATCGPGADPDEDGYTNIEEYRRGTNPLEKERVPVEPELPSAEADEDGDGMPDACERRYGLDPSDPFDASGDPDGDGLENGFECSYDRGMCSNWLNPTSPDTDNDGYDDGEEIEAGTDPCDPDDYPSAGLFPILLIILGILANTGSVAYLIYKRYYVPLVSPPPKPAAVPGPAPKAAARPAGVPPHGVRHHARPRRLPPRVPSGPAMSRELFERELQKRAEEREKILKAFGEKRELPKKPGRVMEEIARRPKGAAKRPVGFRHARVTAPSGKAKAGPEEAKHLPPEEDYVGRLSRVVGKDYVDKLEGLSREEADYMGRLAKITKRKEVPLEEDHVSKLAKVAQKVAEDKGRQEGLVEAFRKSDIDRLDEFLTSRQHVDTFIREQVPEAGAFDALEGLSEPEKKDVIGALEDMGSVKAKETAASKIEKLAGIGSKRDLVRAVEQMSREKHVDKNVFEVLLSYLLKSGKVTKHDVSEILLGLEGEGVLSKKDVADVFFNLGMKR